MPIREATLIYARIRVHARTDASPCNHIEYHPMTNTDIFAEETHPPEVGHLLTCLSLTPHYIVCRFGCGQFYTNRSKISILFLLSSFLSLQLLLNDSFTRFY